MTGKRKGISSSKLKMIAVISMLIDHFGVGIYRWIPGYEKQIYECIRFAGRIAFPIYCFLLVEGFTYTKNVRKYIGRLFLFAVISEVPFDMTSRGAFIDSSAQNVFFTLTTGLLVIALLEKFKGYDIKSLIKQAVIILFGALFAQFLDFDYHYLGVLFIVMFYYLKTVSAWERDIIGAIAFSYEVTAPLAFIPIHFYNGKRGWNGKLLFYWIYPLHLLFIGLIRIYILKA